MEVKNTFTDELKGKIVVKINKDDYKPKVDKQLKELRKKVSLKGFRPGHVPVQIVKKLYGKEVLFDEVYKMVNEALNDFMKKENVRLLGDFIPVDEETNFDFNKEDDYQFAYTYTFTTIPVVNYEEITIPYYKIKVDDKEVEERIEYYQNRFGEFVQEDEVGENSKVIVKLSSKDGSVEKEEVPFLVEYVGQKYRQELVGKKVGDKLEIKLSEFAENEVERAQILGVEKQDLENQPDDFEIEITKIEKFQPAELNEDLFAKVFPGEKIENVEQFKEKIKQQLEKEYENLARDRAIADLKDELIKTIEVKIDTEGLLDWLEYSEKQKSEGERYTREQLKEHLDDLVKSIKWNRIIEKLADDLNIVLERKDSVKVQADYIAYSLQQYGIDPSMLGEEFLMQQAEEEYNKLDSNAKSQIDLYALEQKVLNTLLEKVNKEEKEVTSEFFRSLYNKQEEQEEKEETQEQEVAETDEVKEENKETKEAKEEVAEEKKTTRKRTTKKTTAKKDDTEEKKETKTTTKKKTTAKKTATKKSTKKKDEDKE